MTVTKPAECKCAQNHAQHSFVDAQHSFVDGWGFGYGAGALSPLRLRVRHAGHGRWRLAVVFARACLVLAILGLAGTAINPIAYVAWERKGAKD